MLKCHLRDNFCSIKEHILLTTLLYVPRKLPFQWILKKLLFWGILKKLLVYVWSVTFLSSAPSLLTLYPFLIIFLFFFFLFVSSLLLSNQFTPPSNKTKHIFHFFFLTLPFSSSQPLDESQPSKWWVFAHKWKFQQKVESDTMKPPQKWETWHGHLIGPWCAQKSANLEAFNPNKKAYLQPSHFPQNFGHITRTKPQMVPSHFFNPLSILEACFRSSQSSCHWHQKLRGGTSL